MLVCLTARNNWRNGWPFENDDNLVEKDDSWVKNDDSWVENDDNLVENDDNLVENDDFPLLVKLRL